MTLCPPRCKPRPTYPSECPYDRAPDVNICCLSSVATLTCDPSGSEAVSWSESREAECEDRPLGTNLNGTMASDWDTVAAEAAYACLFGGVVPANYRVRLVTQWTYDCTTGFVVFACALDLFQFDIWGNQQGGNRYYFARSVVDPDWHLSVPITVTCDELDPEIMLTVTCAETTVDLTCDTIATCEPYNCYPLCVANTCPDDPDLVNASILFWNLDCSGGTGDHDGQFEYNPIGGGSSEDTYTAGDWPFTGVPTIYCDGTDIVLDDLDLFGVTWGPIVMTLECVEGEASWSYVFTDPAGGGSGGGPAETCTLTIFTNNGGGL